MIRGGDDLLDLDAVLCIGRLAVLSLFIFLECIVKTIEKGIFCGSYIK